MINFSPSSPKITQSTECNPQKDVLERIIEQNKAIWKAIVKINNKLDNLAGVQKKMIREDNLGKNSGRLLHAKYVLSSQKKPCTRHQKSLKEL